MIPHLSLCVRLQEMLFLTFHGCEFVCSSTIEIKLLTQHRLDFCFVFNRHQDLKTPFCILNICMGFYFCCLFYTKKKKRKILVVTLRLNFLNWCVCVHFTIIECVFNTGSAMHFALFRVPTTWNRIRFGWVEISKQINTKLCGLLHEWLAY